MRLTAVPKILALAALLVIAAGALAPDLGAQYYGRNKVQYKTFDFKIMKTRHFDIYFYLADEQTVKLAGMMAERWYARLSRMFNYEMKTRQPLILYGSSPEFQQTTVIPELMGEGTGGVTESLKRRIVVPYGATLNETDHVIGHELVHGFQYDIMAQGQSDSARMNDAGLRIPLWFIEGMAEYLSIGPVDPNTAMWMRDAVKRKDLPTVRKLEDSYRYFPYRWGQALWAYITGRWGDEVIGKMMKSIGRAGDYEIILEGILGVKVNQLTSDWHKAMQDAYKPVLEKTQSMATAAKTILPGTENSIYNISPAISPDGRQMVFISSRDLFSIDMYLAEVETGKVTRKLISTALDPHFESIQFIRSAGSWSASGTKFVFGGVTRGRPVLTILDMNKDKVEKEIPFPELGEILSPCWSPDGRYIAFSALAGGVTDIFIYDLTQNVLKQMTRDVYGDLQPAWSPDGKTIAFVTERFSTNLEWVDIGHYELALMDAETGQVQKLLAFPNGKNINPQWSADGKDIYFLSDQNGKTDLYRLEIASGKISEVTNLYTGITGITEISPAFSLSASGRIVFSAYEHSYHGIYRIDDPAVLQGQSFLAQFDRNPGLLVPRTQPEGSLTGLLRNPLFGLPKDTNFPVSPYQPKVSLSYVTPPSLAIGVDRYGTYGAGGISAYWSDMLGYRTIITTLVTGPQLMDTSGIVAYQNTRQRMNWGVVGQRMVYAYPYYTYYEDDTTYPVPALVEQQIVQRIINYDIAGFGSYPLNSAARFDVSAGFRYIDYSIIQYTRVYDLISGGQIFYQKSHLPTAPGFGYGYITPAFYYDTGIFGATSPIIGQNFGIAVSPSYGWTKDYLVDGSGNVTLSPSRPLQFFTFSADYRKYIVPVKPFTLAFRALHYARYGHDAEDSRFYPLYIGYWDLVRGYESYNNAQFNGNQLFGSKIFVANVEFRFPILRVLGVGKGYFGAWPLEFFSFFDTGLAWATQPGYWWGGQTPEDVKPWFAGGNRKPVMSYGVGLRTNLFGMLVLGLNWVYPISNPQRGWHFQFAITPGF
jgi:WD40 repeat protein